MRAADASVRFSSSGCVHGAGAGYSAANGYIVDAAYFRIRYPMLLKATHAYSVDLDGEPHANAEVL